MDRFVTRFAVGGLLALAAMTISPGAAAHGGRTDASGCHTESRTGERHCHGGTEEPDPVAEERECCRVCRAGQACGNSCISRDYECHQPPGCACDG